MGMLALLSFEPAEALADDVERFGSTGQVVISSDAELSIGHINSDAGTVSAARIVLAPGADVFVTDGFSVGGRLLVGTEFADSYSRQTLGLGPRIGYGLSLSERWSFHPTVGIAYETALRVDQVELIAAELFAPLQVHPAEHFFVGFGPHIVHEIEKWTDGNEHDRYTTYELRSVIGGYF